MRIKRLNGMFTIATQVEPDKIGKLAERGYKTIICNRPDGEGDGQPSFDKIHEVADKLGIIAVHIPVHLTGPTDANHAAFFEAVNALPKPILAYCRSGTRSAVLWNGYEERLQAMEGGPARDGPERRVGAMQAGALAPAARPAMGSLSAPTQMVQRQRIVSYGGA